MTITSEVCSAWATVADLCSPCDDYAIESVDIDAALLMASDVLFNFTRRRWPGVCAETVRPCTGECGSTSPTRCSCSWGSQVRLPGTPVVAVTEVKVDGVVVSPSEYRVDDIATLVALGDRRWPTCQNLSLDDTAEGTWSVTYEYGVAPPIGGVKAAASLGCQLALACQPEAIRDGRCRLPRRVTTITRQGVTLAVIDPLSLFAEGLVGLPEVDLWVASVNRGDVTRRATIVDPLRRREARRAGST